MTDPTSIWKDGREKQRAIDEIDFEGEVEDHVSVMEIEEYGNSWSSQDGDHSDHNIKMVWRRP